MGTNLSVLAEFDRRERKRVRALYGECAVNMGLAKTSRFFIALLGGEQFESQK
jgi:hypothetical protein